MPFTSHPGSMSSEDFFRVEPAVFIIESPDSDDVRAGFNEAQPLSEALRIAGVPAHSFQVSDVQTFAAAFSEASSIVHARIRERPVVPIIHLSAHGNAAGLALTDGVFVSWTMLRDQLLKFANAANRISPNGVSLINLCMSTCKGVHAAEMFALGLPYPCVGVLGPSTPIAWKDSLTAFVTFYRLTLAENAVFPDAIEPMNRAAGVDCFRLDLAADIVARFSRRGLDLAREYERAHAPNLQRRSPSDES